MAGTGEVGAAGDARGAPEDADAPDTLLAADARQDSGTIDVPGVPVANAASDGVESAGSADVPEPVDGSDPPEPEDVPPGAPADRRWGARLLRRGPWGELAQRWMPEPLRQARVDPGRRGTALLSIVAAIAAVLAAAGVWWNRPDPVPVTPDLRTSSTAAVTQLGALVRPTTTAESASDGAQATSGSPSPSETESAAHVGPIWISVTGRVRHPGLVSLTADARVADAIAAAGGALDPDDLTGINLAAHLSDGDSVVVVGPGGSTVAAESAPHTRSDKGSGQRESVNINTADAATLEELPGVGPVTAAAIVAWRRDHGDFGSIDQLQAVSGIGPATFERLSPYITV